jgi:hypothetical protein
MTNEALAGAEEPKSLSDSTAIAVKLLSFAAQFLIFHFLTR